MNYFKFLNKIRYFLGKQSITGVLVGVEVIEVVALLAELDASIAPPELLHKKTVVLLHDLPDQLPWNRRHRHLHFEKGIC